MDWVMDGVCRIGTQLDSVRWEWGRLNGILNSRLHGWGIDLLGRYCFCVCLDVCVVISEMYV